MSGELQDETETISCEKCGQGIELALWCEYDGGKCVSRIVLAGEPQRCDQCGEWISEGYLENDYGISFSGPYYHQRNRELCNPAVIVKEVPSPASPQSISARVALLKKTWPSVKTELEDPSLSGRIAAEALIRGDADESAFLTALVAWNRDSSLAARVLQARPDIVDRRLELIASGLCIAREATRHG